MSKENLFSAYFAYTGDTEPPVIYHRWAYITALGALLGRKVYLNHGHFRIFPNLYVMLLGEPAARKSTSIKMIKKLLSAAGYENFAADKTTKEKFLLDLEGKEDFEDIEGASTKVQFNGKKKVVYDAVSAENLWGETGTEPREVFIAADEFNEFVGSGNFDFYTTLGNLWDWDDPYAPFKQRVKNSRSVAIFQPTVSILSGNTPELFSRAFPPEILGSGFLSRLLLIHGERSGRKITFPPPPDEKLKEVLVSRFVAIQNLGERKLLLSVEASRLLDRIYQSEEAENAVPDVRFRSYNNRRFTQLQKLCIILSAAQMKEDIDEDDVLLANTILAHAELLMPKALGEFGKNKNSDVTNKIMNVIETATRPLSIRDIWKYVQKDLQKEKDLVDIMQGLIQADRLQTITGARSGFLPKKMPRKDPKFIDWDLLTAEERDMV